MILLYTICAQSLHVVKESKYFVGIVEGGTELLSGNILHGNSQPSYALVYGYSCLSRSVMLQFFAVKVFFSDSLEVCRPAVIFQICGLVVQEIDLDCNWLGSCGFKLLFTLSLSLSHTDFLLLVSYLNWAFYICRFCNIVITSILRCTCLGLGMGQFLGGNTRSKTTNVGVPFSKWTILSIETIKKWHGFGKIWEQACHD